MKAPTETRPKIPNLIRDGASHKMVIMSVVDLFLRHTEGVWIMVFTLPSCKMPATGSGIASLRPFRQGRAFFLTSIFLLCLAILPESSSAGGAATGTGNTGSEISSGDPDADTTFIPTAPNLDPNYDPGSGSTTTLPSGGSSGSPNTSGNGNLGVTPYPGHPIMAEPAVGCCICLPNAGCYCQMQCACDTNLLRNSTIEDRHMPIEFEETRRFLFEDLFIGHVLPSMMFMTEQLTVVAVQQVQAIGMYFDAKEQLDAQLLIQQLQARALKDYYPSAGICEFATTVRSLAASERQSDFNMRAFSSYMMQRQRGAGDIGASEGNREDRESRLEQYTQRYCNPTEQNNGLDQLCQNGGEPERRNKDLDYTRIVDDPETMLVDYTDNQAPTPDEEDLFALTSNLFSPGIGTRTSKEYLKDPSLSDEGNPVQDSMLQEHAIVAKRAVAQNSLNAIIGLKSEGSSKYTDDGGSRKYMLEIMRQLGLPDDEIVAKLGKNPSYYAQMGVLTKSAFQTPQFYIDLYDKPANVARKRVALKALELMQDRDLYRSQLRTEAVVSVLLEMSITQLQDEVQNKNDTITGEGTPR